MVNYIINEYSMNQYQIIVKVIIVSMLILCILGCTKPYETLSLKRTDYTGNELRIDGYYYYHYEDRIVACFLYCNGIIKLCGSSSSIQDFENRNTPCSGSSSKIGWGVFIVEKDIIKYEVWRGSPGFEILPTEISEGKILNDTTFHITVSYRSNTTEKRERDDIYHFRQFYPKPDSTNNFIK
jgi:hypothetical protein